MTDIIALAVVLFAAVVLFFFIGRLILKEYREDREARNAYGQNPSWKDIVR